MHRAPQVAPRNLSDAVLATNALNEFMTKTRRVEGESGRKRTGAINGGSIPMVTDRLQEWQQHQSQPEMALSPL